MRHNTKNPPIIRGTIKDISTIDQIDQQLFSTAGTLRFAAKEIQAHNELRHTTAEMLMDDAQRLIDVVKAVLNGGLSDEQ